jgi:Abnormal spindle-like microcephaly-assoc'd, ASPM-SPD-2-Hydin
MLRTKVSPRRLLAALVAAGLICLGLLVPTAGQAAGLPPIAFSPSSYDYGTIDAGTTASKTFTLTNSGGSATGALTVSLTGSAAFSVTADTCTATSLGPRKSCTVTVEYAPTTAGASDTATLSASGNKRGATATASLTGASTAATSQSQRDCESFGGTFATGTGTTLWTCNEMPYSSFEDLVAKALTLNADCIADGGRGASTAGSPSDPGTRADTTCLRM